MHSILKATALAFAISISFFATSCIDVDKTLGIDNIPDDQALHLQTAVFHLPVQTKMMDSLQALSTTNALLGAIRTPEMGLITCGFATNYAPYSTSEMNWGTSRKIKNIYLTMLKSSVTTMDDNQTGLPQNIHVYRMNRCIDTTSRYGFLKSSDYNHTPVDTGSVIYTGSDTLRVWLKNSFGQDILSVTQLELDSTTKFMDHFKGLLFTCDSPEDGTDGGRVNVISCSEAYLYVTFSFQPTWASGLEPKDTIVMIPLASDSYTENFITYESKPMESSAPAEYIYTEGLGGLKPYVDPLILKDTLDNWVAKKGYDPKKILIGKATYKLPFVTDNSTVSFINKCYPASLYPMHKEWDTTSKFYYFTPLEDIYTISNKTGDVNRSLSCYMGDVSSTVQKLINKDKSEIMSSWKSYAMWFSAVTKNTSSSYYTSTTTTSYTTDNYTYYVGKLNGPLHSDYPTLEIIYAILND